MPSIGEGITLKIKINADEALATIDEMLSKLDELNQKWHDLATAIENIDIELEEDV